MPSAFPRPASSALCVSAPPPRSQRNWGRSHSTGAPAARIAREKAMAALELFRVQVRPRRQSNTRNDMAGKIPEYPEYRVHLADRATKGPSPMTEIVPRCGGWAAHARPDPVTGLVSFPDFHAAFPGHLANALRHDEVIGLAIGDVDHLTGYSSRLDPAHPERFGHLAGNAIMARLGNVSAAWFREQSFWAGCVSTFGGDEIIIAAAVRDPEVFEIAIVTLRDRCSAELPRTVSFALTMLSADEPAMRPALNR